MTSTRAFFIAVVAVACSLAGFRGATAGTVTHTVDWGHAFDVAIDGVEVRRPTLAVGGSEAGPGTIVRVEIPAGERSTSVSISVATERELPAHPATKPHDPLGVETGAGALGEPQLTTEGYAYWRLPDGDVRGRRIAHLLLIPFRTDDRERTHLVTRFEVRVETAPSDEPPLPRVIDWPRTRIADARFVDALLDAPALALAATGVPPSRASVPPALEPVLVEQVIITTAAMESAFQELAEIKTRTGLRTRVTTVEWIYANYEGNDPAARIRAYLEDVYQYQGLRYAILGGDTNVVPERIAINRFQANEGVEVIAELYFGGLDGNWNDDGDDRFGEAPDLLFGIDGDDADLYADISVGRVPAGTPTDAETFVAKWKSYTGHDPATFNDDYQNRILSLGEVLFPANWSFADGPESIVLDGADLCESTLTYVEPTFDALRMYQYWQNPETPGAVPELKDDVIDEINTGYGIIDHVGHGFRTVMSVGDASLDNQDADALTNTNRYSVLYAVNCTSGAVSFDSICEHLINNPQGGVVASISSTDLDFPTISDGMKHAFFEAMFNQDITRMGDAFVASHAAMLPGAVSSENAARWTLMTHILMGDPAMEVWRDTPRTLALAHDPNVALGAGSFTVTVTEEGAPVPDVTVCLFKDDGYAVAETDGAGVATLAFLPGSTGTFQVTATKNTYVPAASTAEVVPAAGAAVRVDGWTLHDGSGGGMGNGDGMPDAGETIVADLMLRNDGTADATTVTATLDAGLAFVTVTDADASIALVGAGNAETIPSAFTFTVDAALPDSLRQLVAPGTIDLTSDQGSWQEEWRFNVNQRLLDLTRLDWSITGDDGDGVLESGESAEILLTVENLGLGPALSVAGVASNPATGFFLTSDTAAFGDIASDGAVQAGPIEVLSTGGTTSTLSFDLTLSDTYGTTLLVRRVDVVAPAPPDTVTFEPSATSIRTMWPAPDVNDLRGYRVYRADTALGPFTPLNDGSLDDGSVFVDMGLAELTSYHYRVTSIDWSGNESAPSPAVAASTSPPQLEGWPIDLPSGLSKGSPTPVDLDRDGNMEIAMGWRQPMVFSADGGDYIDGDGNSLTLGIFADLEDGESQFWNSPAVADIDFDGVNEIVFAAWHTTGDGHLYVLDATGAVEPGWPQEIGTAPWSTAAIGDVEEQFGMEILVASGAGSGQYRGVLFGFRYDGTEIVDGDADPTTHGVFHKSTDPQSRFWYGSPAIGDLTGDGIYEEVVLVEKTKHTAPSHSRIFAFSGDGTVLPGFPYDDPATLGSTSSPAIADLDDDGDREIIAITENKIHVVNADGTNRSGWPKSLPPIGSGSTEIRDFLTSPAIGDVNGDGNLDIALGWREGTVYLYDGPSGTLHAGFPATVYDGDGEFDEYLRSPILGNLDGDPEPEIIMGTGDNHLVAVNADGSVLSGFPIGLPGIVYGAAAVSDVDGDGFVNLIVQTDAPIVSVYEFGNVPWVPGENPWPMFRHNKAKTGDFIAPGTVSTGDPESAPQISRALAPRPNPVGSGPVQLPFEVAQRAQQVRIRVFDVTGRVVRTIADGRFPTGRYRLSWDGRRERGDPLAAGTYFVRTEIGREVFDRKITILR